LSRRRPSNERCFSFLLARDLLEADLDDPLGRDPVSDAPEGGRLREHGRDRAPLVSAPRSSRACAGAASSTASCCTSLRSGTTTPLASVQLDIHGSNASGAVQLSASLAWIR
jgi:hypothetical protein